MVINMETSTLFEDSFVETFDVLSSTSSSIQVGWKLRAANIPLVQQFQVHYQKVASKYIQYGPLLHSKEREYEVGNLVADTYYKVCLVVYRSNTTDYRECTDASTTNWQLPVSVGSSIGAVLALSVIVLIVLLSKCKVPLRYRGKKSKSSTRYDTISSMYHDDQFEFSETVTHGNDDDFVSEFEDEAFYEVPLHDPTRSTRTVKPDKSTIQNGQCRCHVHSQCQANSQHRNSLGRINCSQTHHHTRQFRAYSIQADGSVCFFNQPCSPLAKDPKRSPFMRQDSTPEETISPTDYVHTPNTPFTRSVSLKDYPPTRSDIANPERNVSSPPAQSFTFIDEIPEVSSSKTSSKSNISAEASATTPTTAVKHLLITDIDFNDSDMSKYGASGGVPKSNVSGKTIEMTSTKRMIALPESVSFDEHTV
ncbi:uncharacterized protein LOC128237246 [Mya arenaria]|uniref:uncharacterized protein LOC128237246 n=1 Tax=Mya arenaria TaxID=6604 RepID=UPI0022E87A9D|nr:uncharacterized protein LOC128237246 [Mya arenaria]